MNVFDLFAKISLDTKGYESGIKGVQAGFGTLKKGIGIATASVGAVTTAVAVASKKFGDAVNKTADYGDKVDKMSQKIGISAESYQKWDYVMQRAGTSVDSLKMGMKTLSTQASKNSDAFQKLGISQEEVKNASQEELFEKTIKGLAGMEKGAERTALATQLLGRTGADIGPLLNGGTKAIEEQMKIAEDYGMVMSDKTVKASATFKDSVTTMQMTLTGLKNRMMGEFLPSVTKITDGLALLFTGDTKGLDKISKGLESVVTKISKGLPKVLEIGGKIMESLVSTVMKNAPSLFKAFMKILGQLNNYLISNMPMFVQFGTEIFLQMLDGMIKAMPQLVGMVIDITKTVIETLTEQAPSIIKAVQDMIPLLVEVFQSDAPELMQIGLTLLNSIIQGILDNIPSLMNTAVELITQFANMVTNPETLTSILAVAIQIIMTLAQGLIDALPQLISALPQIIDNIVKFLTDAFPMILDASVELMLALVDAIPVIIDALVDALPQIIDSLVSFVTNPDNIEKIMKASIKLYGGLIIGIAKSLPKLVSGAGQIIVALVKALGKCIKNCFEIGVRIGDALRNALNNAVKKISDIGKNLVEGLWKGISDKAKWVQDKIKGFGKGVVGGLEKVFKTHSPSKVTEQIGVFLDEGLAIGILKSKASLKAISKDGRRVVNEFFTASVNAVKTSRKQIKELQNAYKDAIKQSTSDILGAFSLTDAFDSGDEVDSNWLVFNMKTQVDAMTEWTQGLKKLKKRLGNSKLYKEIEEMGVEGLSTVNAFNELSKEDLKAYKNYYKKRNELATKQAEEENKDLKKKTNEQIKEIRQNTNKQIKNLKDEFVKKMEQLKKSIGKSGVNTGKNVIKGIEKGMNDNMATLLDSAGNVSKKLIKKIRKVLKIKSPSQEFQYIGQMMAEGLGIGYTDTMDSVNSDIADSFNYDVASNKLSKTSKGTANSDESLLESIYGILNEYLPTYTTDTDIVLDSGVLVGQLAPEIDSELGRLYRRGR